MLKNYLKIAWRNLVKNKTFSIINIAGLAIGLACFILIALYVVDELSYDRYNTKADRIYRINSRIIFGGTDLRLATCSDPMGATLKNDYPQVEEFTRLYNSSGSKTLKKGDQFITEERVVHADSTLFNVFTLPAIHGNTRHALDEPNTVVVTASAAQKYFGSTNAVGKVIEADKTLYKITAVIKDIPRTSHFNYDFIFSMDNVNYDFGNYLSHNFQTYILLKPGVDYKAFEKNFEQVVARYVAPQAQHVMQLNSMEEFEKAGNKLDYSLMPVTAIHLHSDRIAELDVNSSIQYVYIFSAVALFILMIACINFMNLSTARSASRAKEVGIRKVLGTGKATLVRQFLFESIAMTVLATIIALFIAWSLLPLFNNMSGKIMHIEEVLNTKIILTLVLLPLLSGIVAGSYPAFFLSRFRPIAVLKGNLTLGSKKSFIRNSLVVFQFATCIILIVGTLVVYRQLNYIQTKKLGFNKDQVLMISGTSLLGPNVNAFKNEVEKMPGVISGTLSNYLPVPSSRSDNTFSKETVMTPENAMNMQIWNVDENYIPTLGMEIVQGRNFSKEFGTDSFSIIINESTAQWLGTDNPLGKKIYTPESQNNPVPEAYTIVGVVKNFHFESMKSAIGPLGLRLRRSTWTSSYKVNTANISQLVTDIEKKWNAMGPGYPFQYSFLDESFDGMYRAEQRMGQIAFSFALLAILIACLGLFGLATYMTEQRTKEIGIRKVLGAGIPAMVKMLSKQFLMLVLISFVIAVPLAWYSMNRWLQDFEYRVNIGWSIFLMAGILAIVIALITVSFQTIKAALANPVAALRSE